MVGRDRINKLKNKEIQINVKSAGTVLPVTRMRQRVFAAMNRSQARCQAKKAGNGGRGSDPDRYSPAVRRMDQARSGVGGHSTGREAPALETGLPGNRPDTLPVTVVGGISRTGNS